MSPKVPQAYMDARRKEIIQAAYKCFFTKGFHNTTMQDIFDAANLSPGAVYNYFPSKEDLVIATVKESDTFILPQLASLSTENPEKTLLNLVNFWVSLLKKLPNELNRLHMDYYSEATNNEAIRQALLESQANIFNSLVKVFRTDQKAGAINSEHDPLSVALVMITMVSGLRMHRIVDPDIDIDAFGNVFKAMITAFFTVKPQKRFRAVKAKPKRSTVSAKRT
jgi:AcrR family transcriptional regulator